ncbi:hypothetical protein SK128_014494, partial [Halocaridina rubra]
MNFPKSPFSMRKYPLQATIMFLPFPNYFPSPTSRKQKIKPFQSSPSVKKKKKKSIASSRTRRVAPTLTRHVGQ